MTAQKKTRKMIRLLCSMRGYDGYARVSSIDKTKKIKQSLYFFFIKKSVTMNVISNMNAEVIFQRQYVKMNICLKHGQWT